MATLLGTERLDSRINKLERKINKMTKVNNKKSAGTFSLNGENILEILASAVGNSGENLFGGSPKNVKVTPNRTLQFELPNVHSDVGRRFEVAVTELK